MEDKISLDQIPAVCNLQDISKFFGVPVRTLRKLRAEDRIPFPPLPKMRKRVLFSGQAVHDHIMTNGYGTRTKR